MAKLKLTDEVEHQILRALQAGAFVKQAVEAAGLHESTFWAYMRQGQDAKAARDRALEAGEEWTPQRHDERMIEFSEAVTRARSSAEVLAVVSIRQAMANDWRAAAFYLERAHAERWRNKSKLDLEHSGETKKTVEVKLPSEAEWHSEVARVLAETGATNADTDQDQ